MPEDGKCNRIYQNVECKKVEEVCTIQDKPPARTPQDTGKNKVYENIAALRVQKRQTTTWKPMRLQRKIKYTKTWWRLEHKNDNPSSGNPEVTKQEQNIRKHGDA